VLLVGDSFSASHGLPIEDSLSRQLERALQAVADLEEMPVKIEVVNAANGGYSPYITTGKPIAAGLRSSNLMW